MIDVIQGDFGHSVVFRLFEKDPTLCPPGDCVDLTEIEVRALFYKLSQEIDAACNTTQIVPTDNAIFYRILTKLTFDLLATVTNTGGPNELEPEAQPDCPQRLTLVVTSFAGAGDVVITGTDENDEDITETVTITADGVFFTTLKFKTISTSTFTLTGDFDLQVYVHNGKARLTWEDGDLALTGTHAIVLELRPLAGGVTTTLDPVLVRVAPKKALPIPEIESLSVTTGFAGDSLTITGSGFLDATRAEFVSADTGAIVILDAFVVTAEDEITADLPSPLKGGAYSVRIVGPGGTSEAFQFYFVKPIINVLSPASLSPGDTLGLTGDGFTGVTAVEIELLTGGTPIALTGVSEIDDDNATAVVPVATALGDYLVRLTTPAGISNDARTLTVA